MKIKNSFQVCSFKKKGYLQFKGIKISNRIKLTFFPSDLTQQLIA